MPKKSASCSGSAIVRNMISVFSRFSSFHATYQFWNLEGLGVTSQTPGVAWLSHGIELLQWPWPECSAGYWYLSDQEFVYLFQHSLGLSSYLNQD